MSQFLNNTSYDHSEHSTEIDFSDALKLHGGGSICDIYRTKWQRREVFVKRLKKEYRSNPLYLDALDKEFEIGVKLKHPSLPNYLEFHRDYIIMEFIDGCTLEEMIKRKDPWLSNEDNIVKMLSQLLHVVDYLHFHHITHCDIKPDNILITANNHDLVLIDFDKSYTDSLNDTSGDPSKYGLSSDDVGKMAIDFHGIEQVVKKLKENIPDFKFKEYKNFINECHKSQPTSEELLKLLDNKYKKRDRSFYWLVTFAPFCVALAFGTLLWLLQGKKGYDDSYGEIKPYVQVLDSINHESTEEQPDTQKLYNKNNHNEAPQAVAIPLSQQQIHENAKEMAKELDKRIYPLYTQLNAGLDTLNLIKNDSTLTWEQLLSRIRRFSDKEDEYKEETFAIVHEMFPDITDREAMRILAYSKYYTEYNKRANAELKEYGQEIERRKK